MENGARILEILEKLAQGQEALRADMTRLEKGQSELHTDMAKLEKGQEKLDLGQKELRTHVSALKSDLNSLKMQYYSLSGDVESVKLSVLNIEHDHLPRIQAALDGVALAKQKDEEMDHRLRGAEARIEIQGIKQFALNEKLENR